MRNRSTFPDDRPDEIDLTPRPLPAGVRLEAFAALFELSVDSSSLQHTVFLSVGPKPILEAMQSDQKAMQYYSSGLLWNCARGDRSARFEFISCDAAGRLRPLLNSTDWNVRSGCGAVAWLLLPIHPRLPISRFRCTFSLSRCFLV